MRTDIKNGDPVALKEFVDDVREVLDRGERLLGLKKGRFHGVVRSARTTHEAVHSHPYSSMGILFGLGIGVGLLAYFWFAQAREEYD